LIFKNLSVTGFAVAPPLSPDSAKVFSYIESSYWLSAKE